jgi:chromosome segregation protein
VIDRLLKEIDGIKLNFRGSEERKNRLVRKVDGTVAQIENELKRHATRIGDLVYSVRESSVETHVRALLEEVKTLKKHIAELKADVATVIAIQDELSNIIFGKESLHSQKEHIETTIERHARRIEDLKEEIVELNDRMKKNRSKKEEFGSIVENLRTDIARQREKQKFVQENMKRMGQELAKSEESLQDVGFDIKSLQERSGLFGSELEQFVARSRETEGEKLALMEKIKAHNTRVDGIVGEIRTCESEAGGKKSQIDKLDEAIERYDLTNAETSSKVNTIIEDFKERYSISLEIFKPERRTDLKAIGERREKIKAEIAALGQVNLLAIEEWNEVKKRYDYLMEQKGDLERAKEDINLAVDKTIKSTTDMFAHTLETVGRNFSGIFRRLFNGGRTSLFLTDSANIFESGVEISACPPGKSLKKGSLLSGGEKGLTAIALLFAIFMVKPSPFCMLDEVDHDLDEENIVRFLKLLKEFADTTQFVIITHNRRTIEFADVIYGVTTEEPGVSKLVSLDLKELGVE